MAWTIEDVAEVARYWLRRELAAADLAGVMSPRAVNPRAQGWLAGFAGAIGDGLELDPARRYELEARLYVALFDGTPMGEQLGLEALQMAKHLAAFTATNADWQAHQRDGADAGRHFVGLLAGLARFGETLRV